MGKLDIEIRGANGHPLKCPQGAVAPRRFFSGGYEVLYLGCVMYHVITFGDALMMNSFVLGAAVPVMCWYAHRRWPGYKLNKVSHGGGVVVYPCLYCSDCPAYHLQWGGDGPTIVRLQTQKSVHDPRVDALSPANIILTGLIVAVAAKGWFAKRHPGIFAKYAYVVRWACWITLHG